MVLQKLPFNKKYTCPYCFTKHPIHMVKFRCSDEDCELEIDDTYSAFTGKYDVEMPHILELAQPTGFFATTFSKMPSEATCENHNKSTTIKICPTCHSELPRTIGQYEDLIFAVVGAKETGKSNFISVLINQLEKEIGDTYGFYAQPLNEDTLKRYRRDFWTPLYKDKQVVNVTHQARRGDDVTRPLLYSLRFYHKSDSRIYKVITFAFFDTAGEDLDSEDTMSKVNKYIYNSSGIILLLDPLQLEHVRNKLPDDFVKPEINTDSQEILLRMTNLIRKGMQLREDKKIDIPVAVAFSKIDAVKPILDPSSALHFPSNHSQSDMFDYVDFQNVQSEIEGLIKDWSETSMTNALRTNYKSYGYFGISSFGHNPVNGILQNIEPYRVTDPFLWLLAQHNVIKTKK